MSTTPDDQNDHPAPHGAPGAVPPPPGQRGPAGGSYPPPPPSGQSGPQAPYGQPGPSWQAGAGYPPPGTPPQGAPHAYGPGNGQGYGPGSGQGYGPGNGQGYGQGYGPASGYGAGAPLSPSDQRLWAVLAHLGTLLLWFIAPLVVWLVFRGRGAFLEDHAKESLNFQITISIAAIALSIVTVVTFGIGGLLYIPFGILVLVFLIIAAVRASQGEPYRYPLTLRLVK